MNKINNRKSDRPIFINGTVSINPLITIAQEPFLLEKYDFDKLINGKNFISEIRGPLLGIWIAFFINMLAKFIGNKINDKIIFDDWEIYAFIISIVTFFIVFIIDKCIPSEQKRIQKEIKSHFDIK